MNESLFDLPAEYDRMLDRGLQLTGESKEYFARGRVAFLERQLGGTDPRKILDFGCGLGLTASLLRWRFPDCAVFGCDTSANVVDVAARRHGYEGIEFGSVAEAARWAPYDVVYTNGVFHHIPSGEERSRTAAEICSWLHPGGLFALFENNPFNPATRLVMQRIPFDRDAKLITPRTAQELLTGAGFTDVSKPSYLFVFPGFASALRPLERYLMRVPVGGQYCLLARS